MLCGKIAGVLTSVKMPLSQSLLMQKVSEKDIHIYEGEKKENAMHI